MSKEATTNVQSVDIDIDALLGTGADNVMLAGEPAVAPSSKEGGEKKSLFSPMSTDTSFLDKAPKPANETKTPEEEEAEKKATEEAQVAAAAKKAEEDAKKTPEELAAEKEIEDALALEPDPLDLSGTDPANQELEEDKNKGGRPSALVTAAKKMIADGILTPFVNDKGEDESIENYTAEDFQELISANMKNQENKLVDELPRQFIDQLPPEMQQAYEYVANGGTDMKGMFQALAASNEVRDLDITHENGQKQAVRAYLNATNYGTPEEIEDRIYALEDRGDLEKEASVFKPKLDAMQEQIVQKRVADQAASAKQRQEQSQQYIENVYKTLETGKLNGIELDNKTQNMLYAGLVQSNYPSISGKQTNMLGHLLEKYQWVEPRHDLIAEALWLLQDPEGYRGSLGANVEKATVEKTMRTLKTEQSAKSAANTAPAESSSPSRKRPGVKRPSKNFFGR